MRHIVFAFLLSLFAAGCATTIRTTALDDAGEMLMSFYEAPSQQDFATIIAATDEWIKLAREHAPPEGADSIERSCRVFISFAWEQYGFSGSPYSKSVMNETIGYIQELNVTEPGELDALWAAFFATGQDIYLDRLVEATASQHTDVAGAAKWSLNANYHQRKTVRQYFEQRPEGRQLIIQ